MNIAVCVIAYNRTDSLARCLKSLDEAVYTQPVKLYISVDKSETDIVEKFAQGYQWRFGEKEVILHKENFGLRKHVLSCGDLLQSHDAVVILEDDIVVSPCYFNYTIQTVEKFSDEEDVAGISLYNFPVSYHSWQPFSPLPSNSDVYLMQNAQSWGQVWMKKQWCDFKEWYMKHDEEFEEQPHLPKSICSWPKSSWLKYHTRYCIEQNKYFVYPYKSLSTCFSEVGVHTNESTPVFQTPLTFDNTHITYRLTPTVIYDAYFENTFISKWLNLTNENICVDYYGDKDNRKHKRYWLSRKQLPYKINRSFGLIMRPYELNVKNSVEGNELFLYDTSIERNMIEDERITDCQFFYMYGTNRVTTDKVLYACFGRCLGLMKWQMRLIRIIKRIKNYVS